MKLTYSTMVGEVFQKYVFEGSTGEVLVAYDAIFGDKENPDRCEKCGAVMDGVCACEPEPEAEEPVQVKSGDLVWVKTGINRDKYASKLGWSSSMDYMEGVVCLVKAVWECGTVVELKCPKSKDWTHYLFFVDDIEPVAPHDDQKRPQVG